MESFYNQGKLGKAFFHLSTRKGFRSSRKGFVNLFPNLGKLLKILGKVSFQIFPKLPWERKGKGKLSVLPVTLQTSLKDFQHQFSPKFHPVTCIEVLINNFIIKYFSTGGLRLFWHKYHHSYFANKFEGFPTSVFS